jgi:Polysaccharide lyase
MMAFSKRIALGVAALVGVAAWLLLAAPLRSAGGRTRRAKGTTEAPYFVGDANLTGNLRPWQYFDSGGTHSVSRLPNGVTEPGVVRVVPDPLGQEGDVYQETVTPTSRWSVGAADGDWTYLYNAFSRNFGIDGKADWIHFAVMFPGGGAYRNTRGEWNILFEAHPDSGYLTFPSACEVAELTLTVIQYDGDRFPYLAFRVLGGDDACPLRASHWIYRKTPLRRNHWYDVLIHAVWSPDSKVGRVQWWLDGRLMYSAHVADLWQRPNGSVDHPEFELNNYREHASWPSTVYYGQALLGPTRRSVAFRPVVATKSKR